MRMFKPLVLGMVVSAVVAAAALGSASKNPAIGTPAAAPAPGKTAPASPDVRASKPKPPKGYAVVLNGPLTSTTGVQTRGTATCPTGTVPFGGGEFTPASNLSVNLNSSFPITGGWAADLNNASGTSTTFDVYVVCANAPKLYRVVTGPATTNPAGAQSGAEAVCPAKTFVLGGGSLSSTGSTSVNINSSFNLGNGWRTDENNASAASAIVTPYAICAKKPKGYVRAEGAPVSNPAFTQTLASISCPAPTVPLSGGGFSGSSATSTNLNSSFPSAGGWGLYEDNGSASAATVGAFALCAGK
jgi:hypothetical protein